MGYTEAVQQMELDQEDGFITGKRHKPGLAPRIRRQMQSLTEKMVFCWFPNEYAESLPEPPDHVKQAFEDVFGSRLYEGPYADDKPTLRLVFHPILGRWCVIQRARDASNSEDLWQVVKFFSTADDEDLPEDFIPKDYENIPILHHLAGKVGEYRLPDIRDFEALEKFDRWHHTATEIENMMIEREWALDRAMESDFEAFEHDFVSYHARMFMDEANQRAGSMQSTWMVMDDYSEKLRNDPRFYKIEHREGYKIRTKRTKQQWQRYVTRLYKTDPAFRKEINDLVGMDKKKFQAILGGQPEDPEKAGAYRVPEVIKPTESEERQELVSALKDEIRKDLEQARKMAVARAKMQVINGS